MNRLTESGLMIGGKREVAAEWTEGRVEIGEKLSGLGTFLIRYGLVLVILWIGAMKFTAYEANGIQPLVVNSPFIGGCIRSSAFRHFQVCLGQ